MRTFGSRPQAARQAEPAEPLNDSPRSSVRRGEVDPAPRPERAVGNFGHDFGRIPMHPGETSNGAPLDASVRARYEPGLGASLADVRIHADGQAAASADALGAEAYTFGRHVVFNAGRYRPDSPEGRRLLAHELTHVIQQRGRTDAAAPLRVSSPDETAEREADHAAEALAAGRPATLAPSPAPPAIYRQPKPKKMIRADRFLPEEKAKLRKMGRGELDELIDQIIADGKYHQVRQQTIDGVEHVWEVKTEISELSEQEQQEGAQYGGALSAETTVTSPDDKKKTHQFTYILRGSSASSFESALHELIHLRIGIDRSLPPADRSSFFSEYSQLNEMTEVMPGAKFGAKGNIGEKSSYGALPIVSGNWEQVKNVLNKIEAVRSFYIGQDASAEAKFDGDPEVAPAALIEFVTQEKYVTQTAARIAKGNAPSNETVANRYGRLVAARFARHVSAAAQTRITSSPVGGKQLTDMIERLSLAIRLLYEALDKSLRQAKEFEKNPPTPPADMPDPKVFETRPVDLEGQPVPLK